MMVLYIFFMDTVGANMSLCKCFEKMLTAAAIFFAAGLQAECCTDSKFELGGNYTWVNLKVDGQSSFEGNVGGVQGIYEYHPANGLYGAFRVAWKQGRADHGSSHRDLVDVDVQERLGYTFGSCCNDWSLSLFSGLGYRYLGHKLKVHDERSVKFHYHEFYVPVGVLSEYRFCSCWSLGLNCIWMPQIYPTVKISPLDGARWIIKNTYSNVLVELPLTFYKTDCCYSLTFKPFYERWENGRSTAKNSNGESLGLPKNTYNFYGAELNFAILF
jgi:outer membrane protein with beta-barrel domain